MDMSKPLSEIFKGRKGFIVIGLTGKTGSGCSTVARVLESEFEHIPFSPIDPKTIRSNSDRKKIIAYNFCKKSWRPFFVIQVRDIITTFILECGYDEINDYLKTLVPSIDLEPLREKFARFKEFNAVLDPLLNESDDTNIDDDRIYSYLSHQLPEFSVELKSFLDRLTATSGKSIYQHIGNNIRKHGDATVKDEILTEHIYALARRINLIIKSVRRSNRKHGRQDFFVIDAFRNPVEIKFFQERYSAFYLFAIRCDDDERKRRLIDGPSGFTICAVECIDLNESKDKNMLADYDNFISQNIPACIQSADIYIDNHDFKDGNKDALCHNIIRYVALIMHPGLFTPSTDEKLMQIAFTAKLGSGCLSRQVGAVVTNKAGAPKAIGWNSTPEDQTPCILRSAAYLIESIDSCSYSNFELSNEKFKLEVALYHGNVNEKISHIGIHPAFCFKSIKNNIDKDKNQVHTRALHAEENAFIQISKYGGEGVEGGKLYTTASPCVLCAKKAYQIGIEEIVYIDPYPDISFSHILESGFKRPQVRLFAGAIGAAYHKLYTQVIPYKDELTAYISK